MGRRQSVKVPHTLRYMHAQASQDFEDTSTDAEDEQLLKLLKSNPQLLEYVRSLSQDA